MNSKDSFGRTPLDLAYIKKDLNKIKLLLVSGASPFINLEDGGHRNDTINTIIKKSQKIWNLVKGKTRCTLLK